MNCEMAKMLINEYIDGRLDEERQSALISHIHTCPGCAEELKKSERLKKLLKDLPEAETPPVLLTSAVKKARQELRQEKQPAFARRAVAIAAALVVVLGVGVYLYKTNPPPETGNVQLATEKNTEADEAAPKMMMEAPAAGAPEMYAAAAPADSAPPSASAEPSAAAAAPSEAAPASDSGSFAGKSPDTAQTKTTMGVEELAIINYTVPEASQEALTADVQALMQKYGLKSLDAKREADMENGFGFIVVESAAGDLNTLLVKYGIEKGEWPPYPFKVIFGFSKP
jgi:hypothetical protein